MSKTANLKKVVSVFCGFLTALIVFTSFSFASPGCVTEENDDGSNVGFYPLPCYQRYVFGASSDSVCSLIFEPSGSCDTSSDCPNGACVAGNCMVSSSEHEDAGCKSAFDFVGSFCCQNNEDGPRLFGFYSNKDLSDKIFYTEQGDEHSLSCYPASSGIYLAASGECVPMKPCVDDEDCIGLNSGCIYDWSLSDEIGYCGLKSCFSDLDCPGGFCAENPGEEVLESYFPFLADPDSKLKDNIEEISGLETWFGDRDAENICVGFSDVDEDGVPGLTPVTLYENLDIPPDISRDLDYKDRSSLCVADCLDIDGDTIFDCRDFCFDKDKDGTCDLSRSARFIPRDLMDELIGDFGIEIGDRLKIGGWEEIPEVFDLDYVGEINRTIRRALEAEASPEETLTFSADEVKVFGPGDCDDENPSISPFTQANGGFKLADESSMEETCNLIDDDCDGEVDECYYNIPDCMNSVDDDGDGLIDSKDPGCYDEKGEFYRFDEEEIDTLPECSNFFDDDDDGAKDFAPEEKKVESAELGYFIDVNGQMYGDPTLSYKPIPEYQTSDSLLNFPVFDVETILSGSYFFTAHRDLPLGSIVIRIPLDEMVSGGEVQTGEFEIGPLTTTETKTLLFITHEIEKSARLKASIVLNKDPDCVSPEDGSESQDSEQPWSPPESIEASEETLEECVYLGEFEGTCQLYDADNDGFKNADFFCPDCTDCDDTDPDINPAAPDCEDGVNCDNQDNNCNGLVDEFKDDGDGVLDVFDLCPEDAVGNFALFDALGCWFSPKNNNLPGWSAG